MTTYAYQLPKMFFDDHLGRCSEHDAWIGFDRDREVRETKTHYMVSLTDDQASEILSDADYYISMGVAELGTSYLGLIASARATAKALNTQNVQKRGASL